MSRKERYEVPAPRVYVHAETCESDLLPCLHEGEARKEARRTPSFQGNIHQALPHKACGWWHVYVKEPRRRNALQRKKDAREDALLRRTLENGS